MDYAFDRIGEAKPTGSEKGTTWEVPYRFVLTGNASPGNTSAYVYNQFRRFVLFEQPVFKGRRWESYSVEPIQNSIGAYECTATYSPKGDERHRRKQTNINGSTKGGSAHRNYSLKTKSVQNVPGQAGKDFKNGINFENGTFQGTDVGVPNWTHTISVTLPGETVNAQFWRSIFSATQTINESPVWWFAAEELKFNGVDYNSVWEESEEDEQAPPQLWWDMKFEFQGSPSGTVKINDSGIPEFSKKGWDYVWISRKELKDENAQETIQKPVAAYVEQMYPTSDFSWFSQLGEFQ